MNDVFLPYSLRVRKYAILSGLGLILFLTETAFFGGLLNAAPTPIAAYSFEGGNVLDESGRGNNGSLSGGARVGSVGKYGDGLKLDGRNARASIGGINISGRSLTISLWFKADDFGSREGRLISKATGSSEQSHYWMISTVMIQGEMRLRFRLKTTQGGTTTLVAKGGPPLRRGVYTHVAATYDGSQMSLYQNGERVGSVSKTGRLATSSSTEAWLGNNPVSFRPFDGTIDNVRIYNEALSRGMVREDMRSAIEPSAGLEGPARGAASTGREAKGEVRRLTLSWAASSSPVVGYKVLYGQAPTAVFVRLPKLLVARGDVNPYTPSVTYMLVGDLGAAPGDRVCFRIAALSASGDSPMSKTICELVPG